MEPVAVPEALRLVLGLMAVGVFGSGLRDLYAALGLPGGGWPWRVASSPVSETSAASVSRQGS